MQRVGFTFRIKPELKDGYKKDHDEIWPEVTQTIKDSGIKNYSIFFRKDGTLFAYLEIDGDFEEEMKKTAGTDVNRRWQEAMEKYFVKEDESILGPETEMLEEVFHQD
ncbi:L-rhamnose mutarotase [Actinomycetota bacterium]